MNNYQNLYLKLYPNVIPVKGYNRSTLTDLYNNKCHFVPNGLIDFLTEYELTNESIFEYTTRYDDNTIIILNEYIEFIVSNNLGLLSDKETLKSFDTLPLNFYSDSKIKNVIFELNQNSNWDLKKIIDQLNECGTKYLEIRFLDYYSFQKNILTIKDSLLLHSIESVHILVPFDTTLQHFINDKLTDFYRLNKMTVYNSKSGFEIDKKFINIYFSSQESVDHNHCGNISQDYFSINTTAYVNNRNNNNCLAYKLSIDKEGKIKNCPSFQNSYGYADEIKISDVITKNEFKELWKITKDKVSICSDCELRWVCIDCRAFTISKENNYSKPSKCNYNPYIALWSHEENFLTEEHCGISERNGKLIIDHEYLECINKRIWS